MQDCIGAIDGTHVVGRMPGENSAPWRSRKSTTSQNIMCAVDFDLCFTFVYAGWEGSAHDSRIFVQCINSPETQFPAPIGGTILKILL
jgi:hypothetical protein